MTDPYIPLLTSLAWTPEETTTIEKALKHTDPWNHEDEALADIKKELKEIKDKVRELHMKRQSETCCYCRTNLAGGGAFMVDREHILPKKKYPELTFVNSNLSVSCKRCNMEFKGDNVDFVDDPATILNDHQNATRYRFVHPNFDKWSNHLGRTVYQEDELVLVKYRVKNNSEKGRYTYKYFQLDRLEIDRFDEAQGKRPLEEDAALMLSRLRQ